MHAPAFVAAAYMQIDTKVAPTVAFTQLPGDVFPFLIRQWAFNTDSVEPAVHSVNVKLQGHGSAPVGRNRFIDAVPKQESPVKRGNLGFLGWEVFTIQVDDHIGFW